MKRMIVLLGLSAFLAAGYAQAGANLPGKHKTVKHKSNGTEKKVVKDDQGNVLKKKKEKPNGEKKVEKN